MQNHQQQQQQQQMTAQQEQENMLSTIFEASCEEATPMTSLIDVHQQRLQLSPPPPVEKQYMNHSDDDDEEEQDQEEEEEPDYQAAPTFAAIDEIPVSTIFSKNESKKKSIPFSFNFSLFFSISDLKYSEYILQKLQTEVKKSIIIFFSFSLTHLKKKQAKNKISLHWKKIQEQQKTKIMNHKQNTQYYHHHHR